MYITLLGLLSVTSQFLDFANCETTCEDSQNQFANLCFSPKPFTDIDWNWIQTEEPSGGWHFVVGNDVARLHLAAGLKGELVSSTDNFDDLCLKSRTSINNVENINKTFDGQYFGFGNLSSNWTCKYSADTPGLFLCDDLNPSTKYHENYNYYVADTDNKSLILIIGCFPNGQVGWHTVSINNQLTDTEKKVIDDKILSLGFSTKDTVVLYRNEICSRLQ